MGERSFVTAAPAGEEPEGERGGEEDGIQNIEDSTHAGQGLTGVFDAGVSFEDAFKQVSGLPGEGEHGPHTGGVPRGHQADAGGAEGVAVKGGRADGDEGRDENASKEALPCFAGGEPGDELVAADG